MRVEGGRRGGGERVLSEAEDGLTRVGHLVCNSEIDGLSYVR